MSVVLALLISTSLTGIYAILAALVGALLQERKENRERLLGR